MPNSLSHALWTGSDVAKAIGSAGPTHWQATGVSIDTRTLQPGDLFIALPGPQFDGHDFIQNAWALGACAVLVHDIESLSTNPAHPTLAVPDTFKALTQLAVAARARFEGRLLAITGSVGKTSVKDGLSHVLSLQGSTSASKNSLNNHLGVPLSLARLPHNSQYALFEVGMNHAGEIAQLVNLLRPPMGLITQVSYQHGQFFSSIDEIVSAKSELFSAPGTGIGIIPRDSPHYPALVRQGGHVSQWITFGQHPESDIRWISSEPTPLGAMRIRVSIQGVLWTYDWSLHGDHRLYNSLAIVAGAWALGADMDQVMQAMPSVPLSQGRGNHRIVGGICIIDDAYNAAPASMLAALKTFGAQDATNLGKRYILLGEMKELGNQSYACHQEVISLLASCSYDGVWLCGPEFMPFLKETPQLLGYGDSVHDVIPDLIHRLKSGDCILIKGAHSMNVSAVIPALERLWGSEE